MNKIAEAEKVLAILYGKNSLIDSELKGFKTYRDESSCKVFAELNIQLHQDAELDEIILRFIDVKESGFFYQCNYDYGLIESFKLLNSESGFYCSLDPDCSNQNASEQDQNYVLSEALELFEIV